MPQLPAAARSSVAALTSPHGWGSRNVIAPTGASAAAANVHEDDDTVASVAIQSDVAPWMRFVWCWWV